MEGNNIAGGENDMKKKLPEDSVFKKKGFFVALYSCVAVVLVLGGVITYNNIQSMNEAKNNQQAVEEQLANANANSQKALQIPADSNAQDADAQKAAQQKAQSDQILAEQEKARAFAQETQNSVAWGNKKTEAPKASDAPVASTAPEATAQASPQATVSPEKAEEQNAEDLAAPVFEYFQDTDKMGWPVVGEIVMDYSVDHVLYDKTLDQYRTNDDIRIAAQPGTPVKASASGVVTKVEKTRKDGNVVVIDNGNGWTTTYGQLMDSVLVKEGEVVKSGQVIGGVSSPTIYGVLLGNHLIFEVSKDEVAIDPKTVLAARS
jgi:murein DD-endopeptidase MepM/ murein hydrolase activator NlpD